MIFKSFISQYSNGEDVQDIIFHSGSVIIKDALKAILFFGVLYGLFALLSLAIKREGLSRAFGVLGIGILLKFAFDVFNKAVDCIVLSKQGITFFARDGIYKYKTEFFGRDSIETISHQQNTIWDKLFFRGDIKIVLDHEIVYDFEQVSNPKKYVKKILKFKDQYLANKEKEEEALAKNEDKITHLSSALSDVIKEYLEKN